MSTSNPVDPLATLQAALVVPANSAEQAELLASLRESLESRPSPIPVLLGTGLVASVAHASDSLLKRWTLDLLQYAICRSALSLDEKTQLSLKVLDTLAQLLDDPTPAVVKLSIQTLTTVYPLLFRYLCGVRSNPVPWQTISACKARILALVESQNVPNGVRLTAVKFMQRAILVQTRGVSDPRVRFSSHSFKTDPNIAFCPPDHPFISAAALESEGQRLLQTVITLVLSSQNVDILSALLNSWATLSKQRPAMTSLIINTLSRWTPSALAGQSASSIKSIEKVIRILLIHMSRMPNNSNFMSQINEVLSQQQIRMGEAVIEEKKRKAAKAAGLDTKKRPLSDAEPPADAKRVKLQSDPSTANVLASFDFTTLPATLITDLIVANLDAFSEPTLLSLIQAYREKDTALIQPAPTRETPAVASRPHSPPSAPIASTSAPPRPKTPPPPSQPVKVEEPVDPLQMDIDQDEMEFEPDRLNEELAGPLPADTGPDTTVSISNDLSLVDFKLPPPKDLSDSDRAALLKLSTQRIWTGAEEIRASFIDAGVSPDSQISSARAATDMSMLLLVRMITRVVRPPKELSGEEEEDVAYYQRQDTMRQSLCDYIMADFASRIRLATTWMNEEWYNDRIRQKKEEKEKTWRPNYETWLNQIVSNYQAILDGKDRSFSRFLLDLPDIPSDIFILLRELCVEPESAGKMQVGFTTLRGFVIQRPALRTDALNVLLELTTHSDKKIRGAAINTVKSWVPNHQPMDTMIRVFALQMLRKLQHSDVDMASPKPVAKPVEPSSESAPAADMQVDASPSAAPAVQKENSDAPRDDENMEDGQLPQEELLHTPYLPERIQLPAQKSDVLQHVELLFALSVKLPEFLEEYVCLKADIRFFTAYGQMDVTVQEAIQDLLTPLIRSLGSSHTKLLTLMRQCPPGAETLALRVLTIFTEHGRPSPQLVGLVKALINERDLDARFLIPIIAEMDKPDIIRHLPRIVGILNGEAEPKNLVRSVFSSIVTTPPQTFGSVTSNLPRVRQSELLTPAELMVLLHDSEKEIGIRSAVEAIGICFSMTDVYRSEILAVVMQQIMDKPVLPVLFLRTVIQAVTTYKSLIGFVSTTLLSRLITKKIWTNPPLWEGFIRCAKVIAPASFNALLQLPKEQLRELVDKQPTLKSGLRDFVMKKATNKARVSAFLDIFGEADDPMSASGTPVPS
ncbi:hypothetical protein BDZ89DRAFT_1188893 [Hymenopellis radicata]|nr:hypothetical protein BDZ89DRAFT_1188893 [Hymenopellis radicata]